MSHLQFPHDASQKKNVFILFLQISDEIVGWTVDIQTSTRNMSRHSSVLRIHIVCLYLCFLDVFVIKTLGIGRQKRYTEVINQHYNIIIKV